MKLLSSIPSLIASGTDIVDRDVTGNVEIEQTALLQLPVVPMKHSMFLTSNGAVQGLQSSSFIYPLQVTQSGVNGGLAAQILRLDRGLWELNLYGNYLSNGFVVVNNAPADGFSITIGDGVQTTRILTFQKNGLAVGIPFNIKRTFLVNGFFSIVASVGGTAVGEIALVDCVIVGNRLL